MKLITNKESEYGKFDLVPEEGQQLRHFIDFESKLIVVSESPIDISKLPSQHGIRIIPSKTYIIEPNEQKILNFEQWKKYFRYEPIETISDDGKLKEVWQRSHEKERNIDLLEGYLIEIETGKKIIEGATSVAFNDKKSTSLIERYYQSIEQREKYFKSLEKGKYPEEKFKDYLGSLKEGELIIQYFDELSVYELKLISGNFQLKKGNKPTSREQWGDLKLDLFVDNFETIENFWNRFSSENNWFVKYYLRSKNRVIEKLIIESHNQILQQKEISYDEHEKLHNWMNKCFNEDIDRNVYWQFCSNCRERVLYYPRYPKHACRECVKTIKDEFGNPLDYQVTHELKYGQNGFELRLKSNDEIVKIFIGKDEYLACEARFGGIVHQKKEKKTDENNAHNGHVG
jgi:hypothetical protein